MNKNLRIAGAVLFVIAVFIYSLLASWNLLVPLGIAGVFALGFWLEKDDK